jgi:hypothetical protein
MDRIDGTLEITTLIGCPVRCRYCPQSLLLNAYRGSPRRMSLDTFRACLSRVPPAVRIDFSGMAEPWLNPDCLAMLRFAAGCGHPLAMFTTLLGTRPADLDALAELTMDPIVFHLPDQEGNSCIPITPKYLALLRQLLDLLEAGPAWRHVRVSCHGRLHPRLVTSFGARLAGLHVPVVSQLSDRAGSLPDAQLVHRRILGRISCSTAQRSLNHNVLLPDGTVILCCMDYACRHVLGNLLSQSYESLRTGAQMRSVLAGLDDPALPVLCRHCVRAVPYVNET